jgi:glycosyltransferase involved in cell wall biosynthesis
MSPSSRSRRRLAIVVQRYGDEVNGGAEYLARTGAEALAKDPRVESVNVLTTCARDHTTWATHYEPGVSTLRGVTVERFANSERRSALGLGPLFRAKLLPLLEPAWFFAQGPVAPALYQRLMASHAIDEFDAYLFYTYLYAPTVFGLPLVRSRSVLIPTAHDEPPIHMWTYRGFFRLPRALGYLTPEEQQFVEGTFSVGRTPSEIIGAGIDIQACASQRPAALPDGPYVTYLGRVEELKGCARLFQYFNTFRELHRDTEFRSRHGHVYTGRDLKLVVAGRVSDVAIPDDPAYCYLGFISEEEKAFVLGASEALFMPSWVESLSLVLLEAWALGCPAIVDAHCDVTRGQTLRADAGRLFQDTESFFVALVGLLAAPEEARRLGDSGARFVAERYGWKQWCDGVLRLVDHVAGTGSAAIRGQDG